MGSQDVFNFVLTVNDGDKNNFHSYSLSSPWLHQSYYSLRTYRFQYHLWLPV